MRNKRLLKQIIFVFGLLILLLIFSYYFEKVPTKSKGIYREPKNTIDYLVIGDSESDSSISPMEIWKDYGYTGYNCGIPGQRIQDNYFTLERLLKKQSPKVILMETNEFYRDFPSFVGLETIVSQATKKILPIYTNHNRWKTLNFDTQNNNSTKRNSHYINPLKGFHYNVKVAPYKKGPYVEKNKMTAKISILPLFYLNKIVTLCKEKHIRLILYSAPSPLCWSYQKHNASAAFAEKNKLPFVDLNLYNNKLGINWSSDTKDKGNHLNFNGAIKVTKYMGKYLYDHNYLSDHRNQKRYASWNKALTKYLKITSQIK